MIPTLAAIGGRCPAATRFRVAVILSLALHALAIWELPPMARIRPGPLEPDAPLALNVRLAPPDSPPPVAQPAPAPRERPRARVPRAPPKVARETPAAAVAAPRVPDVPPLPAATASRPAEPDLLAYVEARRRARGAPAGETARLPRAELDENERAQRIAAANLAAGRDQVFGYDPSKSGGVFMIEHLGADHAEFTFTGWNGDARRYTKQLIEVRKGSHPDIRVAVVRRMIALIRQYEPEEFTWDSQRLGRSLTLSSRLRDNAGLEDFMMLEFFSGPTAAWR